MCDNQIFYWFPMRELRLDREKLHNTSPGTSSGLTLAIVFEVGWCFREGIAWRGWVWRSKISFILFVRRVMMLRYIIIIIYFCSSASVAMPDQLRRPTTKGNNRKKENRMKKKKNEEGRKNTRWSRWMVPMLLFAYTPYRTRRSNENINQWK